MNNSGIVAAGNKILVEPEEVEEVTEGGIVLSHDVLEMDRINRFYGRVVSIGCCAWEDYEGPDWCREGDRICWSRHSGMAMTGKDKKEYILMNDRDVCAVIEEGFRP